MPARFLPGSDIVEQRLTQLRAEILCRRQPPRGGSAALHALGKFDLLGSCQQRNPPDLLQVVLDRIQGRIRFQRLLQILGCKFLNICNRRHLALTGDLLALVKFIPRMLLMHCSAHGATPSRDIARLPHHVGRSRALFFSGNRRAQQAWSSARARVRGRRARQALHTRNPT
jgi:hypothetical protein